MSTAGGLTRFSLKHHVVIIVMCLGLIVLGFMSYFGMPRESFPDIKIPMVFVTTVLDGANPTDVEEGITVPIETKLEGCEGLKKLHSDSSEGLSLITLEFYPDVDIKDALQRVRDAVNLAKPDLPSDIDEPTVKEASLTNIPVLIYHLVGGERISLSELKELADKLKDEVEVVPGVLEVEIVGARERKVTIEVNPERLHFYHLQLAQVQAILQGTNRNVSAGTTTIAGNRIVVRVPGEFKTASEIFNLVVGASSDGRSIYLRDVAMVYLNFEDELSRSRVYDFEAARLAGKPYGEVSPRKAVSLYVKKRSGENILEICGRVDDIMRRYPFPPEVAVVKAMDQSKDVKMMVADLENGIFTSLVLIILVIFVGMGGRNAVIVSTAVPFSMLISFITLQIMGLTLNMIVLFSLILALGMLVDHAVVVVENIARHRALGVPRVRAALDGAAEVAIPVTGSTLTNCMAFVPLVFWPGIMGEFMGFMPKTVIVVMLSSLFTALVINPVFAALFIKTKPLDGPPRDPETTRPDYPLVLKYQKALVFMLARPAWTLITSAVLLVLTFAAYGLWGCGVEFFPELDPEIVTCSIKPQEGTSIEASDRMARQLEERLFPPKGSNGPFRTAIQNVKHATVSIATSSGMTDPLTGQSNGPVTIQIEFVDREFRTQPTKSTLQEIRDRVDGLDEHGKLVAFPLYDAEYNVDRQKDGPPTGNSLSIDIYGEDLNQMARVIYDMKRIMANTDGAAKPTDNAATAQPTLEWTVDRARAGLFALDQATIGAVVKMTVGGLHTGSFGHGDDEQDILLRLPESYRQDSTRMSSVSIPTPRGGSVPLASVATAKLVPGPVSIRHYNRRRVLTAGADVQPGIKADATIREHFQAEVKKYPFPPGITYHFGGAQEEQDAASAFLKNAFVVALFLIAIIIVLEFNSATHTLIIMTSVILSLMGVFLGLLVLRAPFDIIMTGIAIIFLAGVIVNNAMVLLDAIDRYEANGEAPHEAVISACMVRFRPVMLTAVVAILGLVPMALKVNFDFFAFEFQYDIKTSQFWQSMSLSVIFGLGVGTMLTLGVVPCLYLEILKLKDWARRTFKLSDSSQEIRAQIGSD